MRRFTLINLLAALLCLPASAAASPTITYRATVSPLKGFSGTGYRLGAGAALRVHLAIAGNESEGIAPSQLRKIITYLPMGSTADPRPFGTCTADILLDEGPAACPVDSVAGPGGTAEAVAPLAGELVHEGATVQAFFAPGGGLIFYSQAVTPIAVAVVGMSHVEPASPPYGQKFVTEIPLIESVPGAAAASITSADVEVGAAVRRGHRVFYYDTVPRICPAAGFAEKVELVFQSGEVVTEATRLPCPRR